MFSYNFVCLKLFLHTSSQFLALRTCVIQMFGNKIQRITLVFLSAIITYCVRRPNVCPFHRCSLYLGSPHMLVNQFVPLALPISKTPVSNLELSHSTWKFCLHSCNLFLLPGIVLAAIILLHNLQYLYIVFISRHFPNCLFPHLTYARLPPHLQLTSPSTHTHIAATFTVSTILIQCSFLNQISL